jgi:hypothetical protein
MTGPWNVSVCRWNIGWYTATRRYDEDTILVKSTKISRFVSQILRTCQRAFAPIAIQRPTSDQRNRCISGSPGTLPVPESCSAKPDIRCTSQPLHVAVVAGGRCCRWPFRRWRATSYAVVSKLSADPRSMIAHRKTADCAPPPISPIPQMSGPILTHFSDKFVRGLQPPASNQNRTACRSPTVARPLPNDIAANSPNFSPHPHVPRPDCGDCPRDRSR